MEKINEASLGKIASNAVSDVIHFFKGDTNKISDKDKYKNYLGGSISQYSKNLIMTFPVLCDNTLTPDTASMICKANERNVTTMLQLLFTAMNIEANDGMKVLAQIHQNIKTNMDVYDVMDAMDTAYQKTASLATKVSTMESAKGTFNSEKEFIREMMDELKIRSYKKSFPVESLSEQSLNRFTMTKRFNGLVVNEANDNIDRSIIDKVYQAVYDMYLGNESRNYKNIGNDENFYKEMYEFVNSPEFLNYINTIIQQLGLNVTLTSSQMNKIQEEVRQKFLDEIDTKVKQANLKSTNFQIELNKVAKLVDTDVRKANELQPTILQINYSEKKENGDVELRSFLAGIKSRLVAVSSEDMIERIIAKNKTKINFLNFIRATTGEIGFFKDFLFAIDQANIDAKNAVKKGEAAQIWNCLAARAAKNNKNKLKKMGNDASAITMLVLSQETVNYMKSVHRFDLEKMSNTKSICDAYNLMGIIIADESVEVIKSYYVGNNGYERIAFSFLEKENKNSDYKKMVNLMSKMNTR